FTAFGGLDGRGFLGRRFGRFGSRRGGLRRLHAAREGSVSRTSLLHGVADLDPRALVTRDGALDHDQAAVGVDAEDGQVLGGDDFLAEVAGHLLALERATRILTLTGRTVRAVRDGDAVRGAQTAEVPALHGAGEALADGLGLDVDLLAGDEVVGRELGAHVHHRVRVDAEFGDIGL